MQVSVGSRGRRQLLVSYSNLKYDVNFYFSFFSFQGMNFIAGYLILITKNEEESFWLLDALVGRILPGTWGAPAVRR